MGSPKANHPEVGTVLKSASGGARLETGAEAFLERMSHTLQVLLRRSPPGFQASKHQSRRVSQIQSATQSLSLVLL